MLAATEANDSLTYLEYGIYFVLSLAVTIWVGRTLFRSGRPFLLEAFHGNETMADSVNNLLLIGFYLVNVGFMLLFLSSKEHPKTGIEVVEHLSKSVGVVVVVLGIMHFINLTVLNSLRTGAAATRPPGLPPA
ncbi:MAG: hypothetical protein WCJ96_08190 [Verrucomicrobiota bacterium]|jgi:hypothetical protein